MKTAARADGTRDDEGLVAAVRRADVLFEAKPVVSAIEEHRWPRAVRARRLVQRLPRWCCLHRIVAGGGLILPTLDGASIERELRQKPGWGDVIAFACFSATVNDGG